jgi:hypothetical protein
MDDSFGCIKHFGASRGGFAISYTTAYYMQPLDEFLQDKDCSSRIGIQKQ